MRLGGRRQLQRREVERVVAEQAIDAERQGGGVGRMQLSRPRSRATSTDTAAPMANTMAVVWNGGIGPFSVVRVASVAHSRIAPIPRTVAAAGDAIDFPPV